MDLPSPRRMQYINETHRPDWARRAPSCIHTTKIRLNLPDAPSTLASHAIPHCHHVFLRLVSTDSLQVEGTHRAGRVVSTQIQYRHANSAKIHLNGVIWFVSTY
jgi:hypothetical protein